MAEMTWTPGMRWFLQVVVRGLEWELLRREAVELRYRLTTRDAHEV